ncbi:MAG: hypothetical protein KAH57_09530 [Thermoplasmata archaeon]|nr:hypothetical protein [Thermoplasmata archaeon]
MKKRRGKQPVKPDTNEALKERLISLKGAQYSTMNIPIIYRRTFGWEEDAVIFKPINRRSFVVYRTDIDEEEMQTESYVCRELDINDLPWYRANRVGSKEGLESNIEELRESLISFSLTDRYVNVDIKRPGDSELDRCLRGDLEYLSRELGYAYSNQKGSYRCTFIFPRYSGEQLMRRSRAILSESLAAFSELPEQIYDAKRLDVKEALEDLRYFIETREVTMDDLYTQAINVHWDVPSIEPAGFFLMVQSMERSHDELEFMVRSACSVMEMFAPQDGEEKGLLWEEFISLWRGSISPAVSRMITSLEEGGDGSRGDLEMIRLRRFEKEGRCSPQDGYLKELTQKIERMAPTCTEDGGGLFSSGTHVEIMESLFVINRSALRLADLSQVISKYRLYLRNSVIGR